MKLTGSLLAFFYFFYNPYRVSRKFLEKKGEEDVHKYGETPLKTIDKICKESDVSNRSHFFDLGSGRGEVAFYVKEKFKCKVTAIEQIPLFVKIAKIINWLLSKKVTFLCRDYLDVDLRDATHIYLYGTCLEEDAIINLCNKFQKGQKIISITYPLSDYDKKFSVLKKFSVFYPWGGTEAYINEK